MKEYFNFIYMQNYNFIFVYNPKVACTNWKCIMRYLNGDTEDYLKASIAHNKETSGLKFISDIINPKEVLLNPAIKKYSFVRNPYSRILSAYLNKIEPYVEGVRGENDDNSYFFQVYNQVADYQKNELPNEKGVSFYCFLDWIKNVDNQHTNNEHWLPQTTLLRSGEINYDLVGRFENMDEDAKKMLIVMGCDIEFPSQSKVHFAPTKATEKLKLYYTAREIELVNSIYYRDFDSLNYYKGELK